MATSEDDATSIGTLDDSIPPDDMLVANIGAEIRIVKTQLATNLAAITGNVTATHTEINTICDGVTTTAAEVNSLAGSGIDSNDVDKLIALTGSSSDINRTCLTLFATVKTTGSFTAAVNTVYRCDCTGGAINVTLPAGSSGARIGFLDVSGAVTSTNNVNLTPDSGEAILGVTDDTFYIDVPNIPIFVQYDTTYGWFLA